MEARCAAVLLFCIVTVTATPLAEDSERSLRIGSNTGGTSTSDNSSSGYSVSFVPLFSLLMNFFPRLFSRFSGVNHGGSRKLGRASKELGESEYIHIKVNGSFCDPSHLGQWEDTSNCQRFYICEVHSDPPPFCETAYENVKSYEQLKPTTSKLAQNGQQETGQLSQTETYSTPCIIMTFYQCPDKSLYNKDTKECIPQDNANISKLCPTK